MTFDAAAVVRKALDAARADGLTGWHLEWGAARRLKVHEIDVGTEAGLERLWELADAFRAVVWPETQGAEHARTSG